MPTEVRDAQGRTLEPGNRVSVTVPIWQWAQAFGGLGLDADGEKAELHTGGRILAVRTDADGRTIIDYRERGTEHQRSAPVEWCKRQYGSSAAERRNEANVLKRRRR